jgi:hypothetical protein
MSVWELSVLSSTITQQGGWNKQTKQWACIDKVFIAITVCGAKCNEDSPINCVYTYYKLDRPCCCEAGKGYCYLSIGPCNIQRLDHRQPCVRSVDVSSSSPVLSSIYRYIYYTTA